jgi:DNA-binding IclR family transcriptional regulator
MPDPSAVRAYGTLNTLRALEELAAGPPLSAPVLAARLGIGERSARKLLQRCALEGWAAQGDWHHRRYAPTLRLAAVARQLLDEVWLLRFAAPQLQDLASLGGVTSSLWVRDADRDRALPVMRCAVGGGTPAEVVLGTPVALDRCAPGRVLAGAEPGVAELGTLGVAPVFDERGALVAAVYASPAHPADAAAVANAGRIVTELIRDGVM